MIKPSRIDEAIMRMNDKSLGGVIRTKEAAIEFAELILRNGNYNGKWQDQLPLHARKINEGWKVKGSLNANLKQQGLGPWEIIFQSQDAKIISMGTILKIEPLSLEDLASLSNKPSA